MREFLEYMDYAKIFIYISIGTMILTFISQHFLKRYKNAKYIPGLILLGIGFYGLISLIRATTVAKGISSLMIFVVGIGSGIIGLLTGLIINIYKRDNNVKSS
ncbi:MAG TPA: hypothetical protein VK031_10555 [Tissierellaceae bacterium]|nr:hypothetical protein [Tissierellaceae bacterium]